MQGASAQRLAEVRNSDEYRKAYDSVVDFVAKIDEHNVARQGRSGRRGGGIAG